VPPLVQAIQFTADRAGLLYSGDIPGALNQLIREDPAQANAKLDSFEAVRAAAVNRPDVRELMSFAINDDFFRLRTKLKLGLGA
jgi:cellulose synthase operon protein C